MMKSNINLFAIKSKALIYKGELDYISRCVLDYPDIETGGDLFGFWTYSGYPVIQYVIGPGKNANHQFAFFNQDIEYLDSIGNVLREKHGLQHIGEWHSHHRLGLAEPSGHDITTVTTAINTYGLGKFFLVIANVRQNSSCINGFMFKKEQGRTFDYTGWVVLQGDSPIRACFDSEFENIVYKPNVLNASIIDLITTNLGEAHYVKPEYFPEYWLANKSNHLALKQIIDGLGKDIENIKVFQNDLDKSIYLKFEYKETNYYLFFPIDFPQSKPVLTDSDLNLVDTSEAIWNSEEEITNGTILFTRKVLGINSNNFFHKIFN